MSSSARPFLNAAGAAASGKINLSLGAGPRVNIGPKALVLRDSFSYAIGMKVSFRIYITLIFCALALVSAPDVFAQKTKQVFKYVCFGFNRFIKSIHQSAKGPQKGGESSEIAKKKEEQQIKKAQLQQQMLLQALFKGRV